MGSRLKDGSTAQTNPQTSPIELTSLVLSTSPDPTTVQLDIRHSRAVVRHDRIVTSAESEAAKTLGLHASRFLQGLDSTVDFFRSCAGLWGELAGAEGLDGDHLELFVAFESWETSVGPQKIAANARVGEIAVRLLPTTPLTPQRFLAVVESERIDPMSYSLDGGHPSESYVLEDRRSVWVVYYSERGLETGLESFDTEAEALGHLLDQLIRDPTTRLRA